MVQCEEMNVTAEVCGSAKGKGRWSKAQERTISFQGRGNVPLRAGN
jgi:hypothetical protein